MCSLGVGSSQSFPNPPFFACVIGGGLTGAKEGPLKAQPEKSQRSRLLNRVHCSFASSSPIPDDVPPEHFKGCPKLQPIFKPTTPTIFDTALCCDDRHW